MEIIVSYRWFSRRHDRFPGLRIVFVPSGHRRCAWRVAMRRDWKNKTKQKTVRLEISKNKKNLVQKENKRIGSRYYYSFFRLYYYTKHSIQIGPAKLSYSIALTSFFFFYFEMATSRTRKKDGEKFRRLEIMQIFGGEKKKRLLNNGYSSMKFSKGLQRVLRGRRVAVCVCLFTKVLFWMAAERWAEAVLEDTRR